MRLLYSSARTLAARTLVSGRSGLLALLASLTLVGTLRGQEIEVYDPIGGTGMSPAQIIADEERGHLHVFSAGVDANFNGVVEPGDGDVAAAWHILDRQGNLVDSLSFDAYFNSYPVRAAIDFDRDRLYAPVAGRVRSWKITTMALLDDTVSNLPAAGVSIDPVRDLIVLSLRAADFTSPGTVYYVDPEDGTILGALLAGPNPADGFSTDEDEATGAYRIFTLNEGNGSANASLSMVGWSDDVYDRAGATTGFGGSVAQGVLHDDHAFFALPVASTVRVLDATTHAEVTGSPIEIPGKPLLYGIDVDDEVVAVIAEQGGLFVYDRATLTLLHQIKVPGTARRVAVGDGRFYVAGPVNSKGVAQTVITVAGADSTTRTIEVGSMPSNVWSLGDDQILVVGEDDGNEGAWWRVIDVATDETLRSGTLPKKNFDGGTRAAFNRAAMRLGVLSTPEFLEVDITVDDAAPVLLWNPDDAFADRVVAADGVWYLANYPGDFAPDPSWIYGVELGTGVELGRVVTNISVPMLPVPARSTVEGAGAFYAIPTLGHGGPDPSLVWVEHHRNIFEGELGTLANHIGRGDSHCWEEPMTMVTVTGSHEVVMIEDMRGNPTITLRTSTGTSGFDGPRSTIPAPCVPAVFCGIVLTSTYGGEVLLLYEGEVINRADLPGRGEGLALLGDSAYAATVLEKGTFDQPLSSVSPVFVIWPDGSVDAPTLPEANLTITPNRVTDRMQVGLSLSQPGDVRLSLLDLRGRSVAPTRVVRGEAGRQIVDCDLSDLPTGAYVLALETPDGRGARIIRVVR